MFRRQTLETVSGRHYIKLKIVYAITVGHAKPLETLNFIVFSQLAPKLTCYCVLGQKSMRTYLIKFDCG